MMTEEQLITETIELLQKTHHTHSTRGQILKTAFRKYVALSQSDVSGSVCTCAKFRETPMINGKHICSICNKPIAQTNL